MEQKQVNEVNKWYTIHTHSLTHTTLYMIYIATPGSVSDLVTDRKCYQKNLKFIF